MNISEEYNSDRSPRQTFGLKAESTLHRITHNPNSANPGEILRVNIPQLSENVVIVPGSVSLVFDLNIAGHANNRFVNNIGRNLVKELKVSYGGETIQIIQRYDLFKTYEDLFIKNEKRDAGLIKYGISNEDIRKLRAGAGDKPTSPNVKDKDTCFNSWKKISNFTRSPNLKRSRGFFIQEGLEIHLIFKLH